MSDPRITAITRSVPAQRYTQEELWRHSPWEPSPLVDRLFLDSPIASRALFVPPEWWNEPRTLDDTNYAWKQGSLALGGDALRQVFARTDVGPERIDHLSVTSVTGYCTPGLDLLLMKQEGLRRNTHRAHFNNIGCHAAVPLLKVAADHVRANPHQTAVALAVEICSACFSPDKDPQNLVALALFADGAAAAVVQSTGDGPRIVGFGALYDFDHLDMLGFGLTTGGFRIVLDPGIPVHIGQSVGQAVESLLETHGVRREQVSTWCFHPGGSRILDEVQRALHLDDDAMRASRRVLRAHGNMSSPTILFVLAETLAERTPPPGSYGILAAFGPGLGIETLLLQF